MSEVERDGSREGISMAARIGARHELAPDRVVRQLRQMGLRAPAERPIEICDWLTQVVTPATAPDPAVREALLTQGREDATNDRIMHVTREIDVASAVAAVLGRRPEWKRRQHQHRRTMLLDSCFGRSDRDGFGEPRIEPDG